MSAEYPTGDRRPLICGMIAAVALCAVWLLPSAQQGSGEDADGGSPIPGTEQVRGELSGG